MPPALCRGLALAALWASLYPVYAQDERDALEAQLDTPFDLPLHSSARCADTDIALTFEEVIELILRVGHPHLARSEQGTYVVDLRALAPYPEATREAPPAVVTTTLMVTEE